MKGGSLETIITINRQPVLLEESQWDLHARLQLRPVTVVFERATAAQIAPPLEERLGELTTRWKGKFSVGWNTLGQRISVAAEDAKAKVEAFAVEQQGQGMHAPPGGGQDSGQLRCTAEAGDATLGL